MKVHHDDPQCLVYVCSTAKISDSHIVAFISNYFQYATLFALKHRFKSTRETKMTYNWIVAESMVLIICKNNKIIRPF